MKASGGSCNRNLNLPHLWDAMTPFKRWYSNAIPLRRRFSVVLFPKETVERLVITVNSDRYESLLTFDLHFNYRLVTSILNVKC
jgi:hypothetical protein